ncbi:type II secretion system F family protein [Methylovorus glucosotrophus]|uniref:Type II secretion system protein n=1 Tax=Methylovorus glucosotrophus (strain SIP3-4) TaxID=582744 RepID=C6XC19_METGS|nr:type II secretion system F family protein [Methylovorus glucosotrophus]ACT50094.1 type II secretion system protein [Methylovorus glucosotrophus SIP3-4]
MKFELKVARGQQIQSLVLDAGDAIQAQLQAEAQGYSVLATKAQGKLAVARGLGKQKFNLMLFSQELLSLLDSGLSLVEAIEALAEKEANAESKTILTQVMAALYEGLPLSSALERFPQVFPALYVALIRSSERTGDMVQALGRHVTYQGQLDAVRKKIVTASIYPVLLIIVGGLVMLFLLGYVVPKFSTIYESAGTDLPWMSQVLLAWGRLLQEHGQQVFLGFIAVVSALGYVLSRQSVRAAIMNQVWKIPALGETMRIYQLARFYRTLGMLLRGGIPLVTAMQMVSSLLQPALRNSLALVERDIREGKPLSSAMEEHGMTTSIAIRMLRVGERTGRMGEMMERIGVFYDEEIARAVDWFTRLLEPLLMVVIGLVIGVVVVLMYMPIFELAGNIQ